MKIAINECFGGFCISQKCLDRMVELGYVIPENANKYGKGGDLYLASEDRENPYLIQAIEELGEVSWGRFSKLRIVSIPDNTPYEISEYDGMESVEAPRTFYS